MANKQQHPTPSFASQAPPLRNAFRANPSRLPGPVRLGVILLLLSWCWCSPIALVAGQSVQVLNGSLIISTPGATFTLSPLASPSPGGSGTSPPVVFGLTSFANFEGALAATMQSAANTPLSSQVQSVQSITNMAAQLTVSSSTQLQMLLQLAESTRASVSSSTSSILFSLTGTGSGSSGLALAAQLSSLTSLHATLNSTQLFPAAASQAGLAGSLSSLVTAVSQRAQAQSRLVADSAFALGVNATMQVFTAQQQATLMAISEGDRAVATEASIAAMFSAALTTGLSATNAQLQGIISRAVVSEFQLAVNASLLVSSTVANAAAFTSSLFSSARSETSALRASNNLLWQQLQTETNRALQAEASINSTVNSGMGATSALYTSGVAALFNNISAAVRAETLRATNAESQVNTTIQLAVTREALRATSTIASMNTNLTNQLTSALSRPLSITMAATNNISNALFFLAPLAAPPKVGGTLWAWLDGSNPTASSSVLLTSFALTTWSDRSPNAIHVDTRVGGVSADISYIPNVKNGRGAVLFTGNAYMTSSKQTTPFAGTEGVTWFVVYRTPPDTATRSLASLFPEGSGLGNYYNWYLANGATERWESGQTPRSDTFNTAANTWVVSVGRQGTSLGRTHMSTFTKGVSTTGLSDSMPAVNRGLMLGNYAGSYFNNYIGEMVIYNNYLSDGDMLSVFNWLRAKWAI